MPYASVAKAGALAVLALILHPAAFGAPQEASQAGEDDTFSPYVRGLYGYDSNLFRLPGKQQAMAILGSSQLAESYFTLAAGMDARLRFSRQTVLAHAEINRTQFSTYDTLDYAGRDVQLRWNWVAGSRLAGSVGVADSLTQGSYANVQQPVSNLVRTRRGFFDGAVRVGSPWQILAGFERTETDNEAAALRSQDATTDQVRAGIEFETRKGSTFAFMSRQTDGRYPNRQLIGATAVDNDYRQWDNGFDLGWAPTDKTRVNGVLNYTRRSYADVPQRDFSGMTGRLGLDWRVTDKTTLKAGAHRDIGVTDGTTASYAINNGVSFGADWKATSKLALSTGVRYDHLDYAGDPAIVVAGSDGRKDRLTTLHAGVEYAVLRNAQLGLSLQRGTRQSGDPLADHDYNRALVTVKGHF